MFQLCVLWTQMKHKTDYISTYTNIRLCSIFEYDGIHNNAVATAYINIAKIIALHSITLKGNTFGISIVEYLD